MTAPVAATVATYDAAARAGTLLRDDGTRHAFGPGALDPAVRLLRSGQRVRVLLQGDEVVSVVLPFP